MKKSSTSGFTLIELMVTVAIIAVLSAIVTANFGTARAKSRDAKRVSDLAHMQLSLEFFFDRCNQYPAASSIVPLLLDKSYECPTNPGVFLSNFISVIPTPPPGGSGVAIYEYGTNAGKTNYILRTQLEVDTSSLLDDIDDPFSDPSADAPIPCDDAGKNYCVGPK